MSVFVVPFHHSSEILVSVVLKNCVETICTIACTAEQLLQLGLGLLGGDIKLCNPPEELTGLATPLIESQLQVMAVAIPDQVTLIPGAGSGAPTIRASGLVESAP